MYLTGVSSTDSATTSAFLVYIYISESTSDDIDNIILMQLNDMQKACVLNLADDSIGPMTDHHLIGIQPHHIPRRRTTHSNDDNDILPPGRHPARLHRYDIDILLGHVWSDPTCQ
jgi:hypothetical protein